MKKSPPPHNCRLAPWPGSWVNMPERASRIVGKLLDLLEQARSADEKWRLLLALGNSGAAQALAGISRNLDDPQADIRGAAGGRFAGSKRRSWMNCWVSGCCKRKPTNPYVWKLASTRISPRRYAMPGSRNGIGNGA